MGCRCSDYEFHVVRSHCAPILNPNTRWFLPGHRPHDHIHVKLEAASLLFPANADTLRTGLSSHTCCNRQTSNLVQMITRKSAPEYMFRDPIAVPLFAIAQIFTLLNFPIMWIQITQAAKKLKSAVRCTP